MNPARLIVTLLLACFVSAQQPAPATEISFERVTRASKESLRDSAELPMVLTTEFSAVDLGGRVREHRTGKFDYDFHGYNPRSNNGLLNLLGPKTSVKEASTAAAVTMLPSILVAPGVEQRLTMKMLESPQPGMVVAEFVPEKNNQAMSYEVRVDKEKPASEEKAGSNDSCQSVGWMRKAYLFTNLCLTRAQVQLQKGDLAVTSFAWDTGGLPVQAKIDFLGKANITGYHVDIDFQKATLPGDPKPFVVPRHVTVTVITDKGKLQMAGDFALKK
ncbi:MAG TPA: hypothetical protein VIB39_12555 [Candidatus Angelobacter sp.]